MSVNTSSPMAVNDAIRAAADQILAGMKGGAFFPHHENNSRIIGEGNANGSTAKSEQHASSRHSPTTVYHHSGTSSTVAHALRAECYVKVNDSQSSQVTFDSKEGPEEATATVNGGGGSGLNKNTSALSLTSSEVSHPIGSCQPEIKHQVEVQQGPPMQQVTFSTGINSTACAVSTGASVNRSTGTRLSACTDPTGAEEDRSTGTKRSAASMDASLQEHQDQPPSQKPRLPPSQGGSLPPPSLVGPTHDAGTPVAQQQSGLPQPQPQPQLVHHLHSPSDGVQAPGQVTFQAILPAPPAMAKQEVAAKPQEINQAQVQEHSTLQSNHNYKHPKLPIQPTPAPVNPAQGKHTSGPITGGHQLRVSPPPQPAGPSPSLVSTQPLAAAQTPAASFALTGSQQPMVNAKQPHFAEHPKPTEWETKVATQPPAPVPATVPVPHRMALPPIYPKPHPAVQYHNHYHPPQLLPPPSQMAHSAMQSYSPPPPPAPKQHYAPPHQVAMSSIPPHTYHVDNTNHTHQATQFSTDHTTTTASTSGTAATLAAAHSYPYTSTTTTHAPHYYQHQHPHYHHPVNNYHTTTTSATSQSSFAGSTPTATDAAQVLPKPSFHNQANGSTAGTSWSNIPSYTTATAGQGPAEASQEDVANVRNHKMQATDCLLFAASLLQEGPSKSTCRTEGAPASQNASSLAEASSRVVNSPAPATAQAHAGHAQTLLPSPSPTAHNYHAQHPSTSYTLQESTAGKAPAPGCPATSAVQKPFPQSGRPQDLDVLCGRGGLINKHVGNIIYRKVVEHNKKFYQTVQKRHRILVSQSIVHTILNRGGHFLSEETKTVTNPDGTRTTVTTWKPVATARAIQKTSQALRERITSSDGSSNGDQKKPAAACAESTA